MTTTEATATKTPPTAEALAAADRLAAAVRTARSAQEKGTYKEWGVALYAAFAAADTYTRVRDGMATDGEHGS